MAATHTLKHAGSGIARVRIGDARPITIVGTGARDLTLSSGSHDIAYGISGQAGTSWALTITKTVDEEEVPVWSRKGKMPKVGLEIGTDRFKA